MKPHGNSRFLFPGQQDPPKNPEANEKPPEKQDPAPKSDLELKRELLRKKKEELEKKLEKKVADPVKNTESGAIEENKNSETPANTSNPNPAPLSNAELLKKKREELERKKKEQAANQPQPQAQPENANRLEELKKKYQKPAEPAKKEEEKPAASGANKLEELKKKYQNNNNSLNPINRVSEPMYRTSMGKSVSTTHVACESKTFKFPAQIHQETSLQEEEKAPQDTKEDFLKRMEMLQAGLDKKLDKMKTEEASPLIVVSTKSMDLGQPAGINLNQYRQGLKKNLLSINPEAEKLINMPKKILTPSGMRIHSTLADRVAGLEALFGGSGSSSTGESSNINEMKPELKKKIEDEIEICLKLYHLSMERPELPEKKTKPKATLRKRMSKEWN